MFCLHNDFWYGSLRLNIEKDESKRMQEMSREWRATWEWREIDRTIMGFVSKELWSADGVLVKEDNGSIGTLSDTENAPIYSIIINRRYWNVNSFAWLIEGISSIYVLNGQLEFFFFCFVRLHCTFVGTVQTFRCVDSSFLTLALIE